MNSLNVVFMGTPEFAVPTLRSIHKSRHTIAGVVSQPDRRSGRGKHLHPPSVKQAALDLGTPIILQPEKMKDPAFIEALKSLNADIFVVVAFRILPAVVFDIPAYGTINLHPSLLPRYRGAAPLNWTIINGDRQTAITTIAIQKEIDAGNIILQQKMPVFEDDTAGTLHDRLSVAGAKQILQALNLIAAGPVEMRVQDNSLATPAPKLTREMCHLNFNQPVLALRNWIHGLSPYPGGYAYYDDLLLKILRARVYGADRTGHVPGEIIQCDAGELLISAHPGIISVEELQLQGRKRMDVETFLRGSSFEAGKVLR